MPDDKDQMHERKDERYVEDLIEYFSTYINSVIDEMFVGIGIALGQSEKQAYSMIGNNPNKLEKAFFKDILEKFRNIFKYKIPKFRIKSDVLKSKKPLTPQQWDTINKSLSAYWKQNTGKVTEDMVIKGYILGRNASKYRKTKVDNAKKTLPEIIKHNPIPGKFADAYKRYDFKNAEKNALNRAFSNIAMHVTETEDGVKHAIRKVVTEGINEGKTPVEVASDLYWNIQKESGNETAESMRRNWNRISATEMNAVFEAGILAPYEAQAMESIKDNSKAVYYIRVGGTCSFCVPLQGSIVRLLPENIVDKSTDSLKSMGIDDPYTDIAIWVGKNNIGRKRPEWWNCVPGHPWNRATYQPFNPDTEKYNSKTGRVERKQLYRTQYVPEKKDYVIDKEERKPKFLSGGLVKYNNNIYESVSPSEYNRKKDLWDRNTSLPIPVSTDSTRYDKIFGAVE